MDSKDFFVKLRDVSNEVVVAMENENADELENAMGKFLILMMKADALK